MPITNLDVRVANLPPPPPGEYWRLHPWSVGEGAFDQHILSSEDPSYAFPDTPYGPNVRDCSRGPSCLGREGCAVCNPRVFTQCWSCYGPERFMRRRDSETCECFQTCPECDTLTDPQDIADLWMIESRRTMCYGCRDRDYSECDSCGNWYADADGHNCPDRCSCGSCDRDDDDGEEYRAGRTIQNYSYKPAPEFHGTGPVYLGVEVEVSTSGADKTTRAIAEHVQKRLGNLGYLKEDSSISEGFEIVTHPMSHEYATDHFPWNMWEQLQDMGMRDSSDCGIHVHVNRDGFSGVCHSYRWLKWFHRNESAIKRIARRDSGQWAPFRDVDRQWAIHYAATGAEAMRSDSIYHNPYGAHRRERWYMKAGHQNPAYHVTRYSAVNVTNEHTFEVRVFAGTIEEDSIRAALSLVHASVEFTRQLTAHTICKGAGWEWSTFTAWLAGKPEYAALRSEIERLV